MGRKPSWWPRREYLGAVDTRMSGESPSTSLLMESSRSSRPAAKSAPRSSRPIKWTVGAGRVVVSTQRAYPSASAGTSMPAGGRAEETVAPRASSAVPRTIAGTSPSGIASLTPRRILVRLAISSWSMSAALARVVRLEDTTITARERSISPGSRNGAAKTGPGPSASRPSGIAWGSWRRAALGTIARGWPSHSQWRRSLARPPVVSNSRRMGTVFPRVIVSVPVRGPPIARPSMTTASSISRRRPSVASAMNVTSPVKGPSISPAQRADQPPPRSRPQSWSTPRSRSTPSAGRWKCSLRK